MDTQFLEIFNLYKNDIYRLAYSYTKNLSDAEDITQNVFLKLYKHHNIFTKNNYEIKKWLIKVTINECKTLLLSSWYKKIFPLTIVEENNHPIEDRVDTTLNTILTLPQKQRLILFLYYYEGYKIKEISQILKLSETNIQTILGRSRDKLKIILKEE